MNWIKTSERLPESEGRYAIVYESNSGRIRNRFIGDYDPRSGWSNLVADTKITHWAEIPPLPEPPEGE